MTTAAAASDNATTQKRTRKDSSPAVAGSPEPAAKPRKATKESKAKTAEKKAKVPSLPTEPVGTRYSEDMRPERLKEKRMTFMSWNVAGLRALLKKDEGVFTRLCDLEGVDVLCLQEHKLQDKHIEDAEAAMAMDGWSMSWNCSAGKAGYSGVALLYRESSFAVKPKITKGIGSPEHDLEGRVITMELDDKFLVNVYVPNAGAGLKRLEYRVGEWDTALAAYLDGLRAKKPVVVTGDFNCAREPIDIHNAKNNVKSAGFTPEERESFAKVFVDGGWVDTFRVQHPDVHGYTYYGYRFNMREKKKGWRLDYFLVSEKLADSCHDSFILPDFLGSDHCPLGLTLSV